MPAVLLLHSAALRLSACGNNAETALAYLDAATAVLLAALGVAHSRWWRSLLSSTWQRLRPQQPAALANETW